MGNPTETGPSNYAGTVKVTVRGREYVMHTSAPLPASSLADLEAGLVRNRIILQEAQNQLRLFQEQGEVSRKIEARIAKIVGQRRKLRPLPGINKFSATLWLVGEYLIILKTQDDPHYALQIRDQLLTENVYAIFDRLWQMTNP